MSPLARSLCNEGRRVAWAAATALTSRFVGIVLLPLAAEVAKGLTEMGHRPQKLFAGQQRAGNKFIRDRAHATALTTVQHTLLLLPVALAEEGKTRFAKILDNICVPWAHVFTVSFIQLNRELTRRLRLVGAVVAVASVAEQTVTGSVG